MTVTEHRATTLDQGDAANGSRAEKPHARHSAKRRVVVGRRIARTRAPEVPSVAAARGIRSRRAIVEGFDRTKLTDEERERGLRSLAELEEAHARMLADRGGRPFSPPNWVLINEARDERSRELG